MLQVEGVSKTYERPPRWLRPLVRSAVREPLAALKDVSFEVHRGQIVGLIGPNGAGKTTLLKIISTLLEPTTGSVTVDGYNTTTHPTQVCQRLGLVLEGDQGLFDRLNGHRNLRFYGMLAGMSRRQAQSRADELLALLELAHRDKLVFGYSAGMRMRLSIARALMADPPLIILDEATRSLDPLASRFIGSLLRGLAAEGRAVLMSNHRLDEVVSVCDQVVAVVNGEVRYAGAVGDVTDLALATAEGLTDLLEREVQRR